MWDWALADTWGSEYLGLCAPGLLASGLWLSGLDLESLLII